jgi:DNA-binding transcriptional LysR family regulator
MFGAMYLGESMARYMDEHPGIVIDAVLNDRYADLLEAGIDVFLLEFVHYWHKAFFCVVTKNRQACRYMRMTAQRAWL